MAESMQAVDTPPQTFEPAETLDILDLETLKVMADERRMQIVDLLRRAPATVKEIAAALQVPPKSLYYHVNLMEQHGLIRVVDTRLVSGIVEKRYRATAYLFNFSEMRPADGSSPAQVALDVLFSTLTMTRDEIRVDLESGLIDSSEGAHPASAMNSAWTLLNLTPDACETLADRIETFIEEFSTVPETLETRPYRLFYALFPTYRRGERPDTPSLRASGEHA
jgi:DNA-binding transcriptional ArsR family regulator